MMTEAPTNPEQQALEAQEQPEISQDDQALSANAQAVPPHSSSSAPTLASSQGEPVVASAKEPSGEEMSFAQMLEEHEREEKPQSRLNPGQRVSARVVAITSDTVFVSTGAKVDGIVDREELLIDGELPCKVGDTIDLYVVTATAQEVKLSKMLRGSGNISALEEARDAGLPIEGKVTAQVKGGYSIDIMKRRAFCPGSQIDLRPLDDPESVVGKTMTFIITRLEKGGRNIVVSRRALLEREQAESREAVLSALKVDDVIEAVVVRVAPFGAFVDLGGGVEGLVHVSELAWGRIASADEAVSLGDKLRVKVTGIEQTDKGLRISLSAKKVMDDPWKDLDARLHVGDCVEGKVVRTAPFGAFVEVLPGIEGLVHLSELSYERRVNKTEDVVVAGDHITVKVKEVDLSKKRVSLSLRDVAGNPWDTLGDTFSEGQEITGTLEKRAPFGFFITLAPGITGLLPNSSVSPGARKELDKLSPGGAIEVVVKEVDRANRKISLGTVGGSDEQSGGGSAARGERGERGARKGEERDWKQHAPKPASLGSLGSALQAALDKKKK